MQDKDSVEHHPLIGPAEDLERPAQQAQRRGWLSRRSLWIIILVQGLALLWAVWMIYATPLTVVDSDNRVSYRSLYSPAQDAIEYETRVFNVGFVGDLTPYQKPPSDELDAEWDALYNFGISKIPKHQAARLANKTEPIPGDDGYYIVELDVFHQLHCLNVIRKALYPDHYPSMAMNTKHNIEHVNHCVDNIRQSLMCSADISTIVWQWEESIQKSIVKGNVAHTCRNYDRLRDWALERVLTVANNASIHVEDDIVIPIYQPGPL